MFGLEEQLDSFDGGGEGLGDDAGESTCEEVEEVEIVALWWWRGTGLLGCHILGQYNQMKEYETDARLIDLLTGFMQHFKSVMAVKLSLIESLCSCSTSLQSNPQFLLSKYSNKSFKNEWQADPCAVLVSMQDISVIDRFYLRIQQYLQYRLGSILSINKGCFQREVEGFQKELQRVVKKFEGSIKEMTTIGELFSMINLTQIGFTGRLIDYIEKGKASTPKGLLDIQSLQEVRTFIANKISKEQKLGLKEIVTSQERVNVKEHRLSLPSKTQDTVRLKNWIKKKLSLKRETPVSIRAINFGESAFSNNREQKNVWSEKQVNVSEDESLELQKYVELTQKKKIELAYSILDIEENYRVPINRAELFGQLQQRNIKNKLMVQNYIQRYQRKLAKKVRREERDKTAKSTTKSTKASTPKTEQTSIFQQKAENSQNITPLIKKNSQNFRKLQGLAALQLPLIASRHNRRTTVQK